MQSQGCSSRPHFCTTYNDQIETSFTYGIIKYIGIICNRVITNTNSNAQIAESPDVSDHKYSRVNCGSFTPALWSAMTLFVEVEEKNENGEEKMEALHAVAEP